MRKNDLFRYALLPSLVLLFVISCKYDEVLPIEPDPGEIISFNDDLVPIFNNSCNMAGCHNASGPEPDLSPLVAYDNLWEGMYIDTMTPEDSELYLWMSGSRGLPMPPEGVNPGNTSDVLQWITQGALNN